MQQYRLSKYLALFSQLSRRDAESVISIGGVSVNGTVVTSACLMVGGGDAVNLRGMEIKPKALDAKIELYCLHKPAGYVVTRSDELSRKTIYDILPKNLQKLTYIGRLDLASEGLLLLTNDPNFARKVERSQMEREYNVRVHGMLDEKKLYRIGKGVTVDGESYRPKSVELISGFGDSTNTWLRVVLTSGKNREIRRLMEHFNLQVNRLERTRFGNISLREISKGTCVKLTNMLAQKFIASINEKH